MSLEHDAQNLLAQYEQMAQAGTMDSRQALVIASGLGWGRYLRAHHYMIRHLLADAKLAIRYEPPRRLWTAGAERFNGPAGYDEFPAYVRWHAQYLSTRAATEEAHLKAISTAFPAKARTLRPLRRYAANMTAEVGELLDRL